LHINKNNTKGKKEYMKGEKQKPEKGRKEKNIVIKDN
jgi:hypothetical protein